MANIYWTSTTGTALWAAAESDTPLDGTACCSLSTAKANAAAGDTVNMRAGTYAESLTPANSGTSGNVIWFTAYNSESVIINTTGSTEADSGIYLTGQSYLKFSKITVQDCWRLVHGANGSTHIELDTCVFQRGESDSNSGFAIRTLSGGQWNEHWWMHDCTVAETGYIGTDGDDKSSTFKLGAHGFDQGDTGSSGNWTIENCLFYHGGHHLIETYTCNNIIRNCRFYNDAWMEDSLSAGPPPTAGTGDGGSPEKWGNRCIQIYDGTNSTAMRNVVEHCRIGHAGEPPDGNGASNLVLTSPANIARFNTIYNAREKNIYLKQGGGADSENNRIYNNTCHTTHGVSQGGAKTYAGSDNIFFNDASNNNVVRNNIFYNHAPGRFDIGLKTAGNTVDNNWVTTDGDPLFTDDDMTDPTSAVLPDLSLQAASPCIENGTNLTTCNGADVSSITLIVNDSEFFQDGSGGSALSNVQADWIAIGTTGNVHQIVSINYSTDTIILATATTWSDADPVWLYKTSDGTQVLFGSQPDQGSEPFAVSSSPAVVSTGRRGMLI